MLVDPDKGLNIQRKLASLAAQKPESLSSKIFQSLPKLDDPLWTKQLIQLPKITFSVIYDFLVDRKVILRKVSYLESVADVRAEKYSQNDTEDESISLSEDKSNPSVATEYTRTLDKAYRYFQDGHIQDVKYHPMPNRHPHFTSLCCQIRK